MCGQTNVWILPDGDYKLIRIGDNKVLVCGQHAAYNMSFQQYNNGKDMGVMDSVADIKGEKFINCVVHAPLTPYKEIPVLPLLTIKMDKGTGVVTSVPSDAPDDYAALKDIKTNNEGIVDKYHIDLSLLENIKPIEIIDIPSYGKSTASTLCEERGVKNQHDTEKLKEIKEICYKQGFYEGVMIAGPFAGHKVQECKELSKKYLIDRNEAFVYGEPESEIIARSGCKCVVAKTNQWFIDYGEEKWKNAALECLKGIDTYSDEVKNQFERVLDWLKQWALSRTFGLGTRIPWDKQYLVESLSDSTLYNAFYTIADVLQAGDIYGKKCPMPIELLDIDFFDYVFDLQSELKPKHEPYAEIMKKLRQEF